MKENPMASNLMLWFKRKLVPRDQHKDLLRYSFFKDLNAHQRGMVASFLHSREFRAGESVFEHGYPLQVIYFIESGEMEVTPIFAGDHPTVLKQYQFIGLIDLFGGQKRLSSAKAITDLKLKALPEDDLQEMLAKDPALGVKLLKACCDFLGGYIRDHAR